MAINTVKEALCKRLAEAVEYGENNDYVNFASMPISDDEDDGISAVLIHTPEGDISFMAIIDKELEDGQLKDKYKVFAIDRDFLGKNSAKFSVEGSSYVNKAGVKCTSSKYIPEWVCKNIVNKKTTVSNSVSKQTNTNWAQWLEDNRLDLSEIIDSFNKIKQWNDSQVIE